MKKFIKQILFFLIFPLLLCVLLLFSPLNRKYAWNSLPTDCDSRGTWIWTRLFVDTTSIDVAFLGTSHTINGIQDTLIGRLMSSIHQQKFNVVNLGYCRFGNEMQYIIAKDLFSTKKPKMVFIEINEKFGTASHPVYPYYAETKELIQPASFVQQSYCSNLYEGFLARLSQFRTNAFFRTDTVVPVPIHYGYRGYPDPIDDFGKLVLPEKDENRKMGTWRNLQVKYPQAWIADLVELCRINNAQVYFIYIPSFHDQAVPVEGMEYYSSMANVLTPPSDLLRSKDLWRDPDHLNDKGANTLAHWIFNSTTHPK